MLTYILNVLVGGIGLAEQQSELRRIEKEQERAEKRWKKMFAPSRLKCMRGNHTFTYARNEAGEATHLVCRGCGKTEPRP